MKKMLTIGDAAKALGVTTTTLRNWDKKGLLKPDELTKGGDRRYRLETLKNIRPNLNNSRDNLKTIAYARVSSHDQKQDLIRQVGVLESYCASRGFVYEVIQDLGSGMNYYKKGLTKLLNLILDGQVQRLVLTHKDRLLRFGAELVFSICEAKEVEVIIINKGEENIQFEEEFSKTCSTCGNVKQELKLSERTYVCSECGVNIDRDYNASLNLKNLLVKQKIGRDSSEFTPVDLTALLSSFSKNRIATSKVETGMQHKS